MNLKFTIDNESHQIEISPDKTILDHLEHFDIPYSCRSGHCSSCMCKLISGKVDMKTNLALTDRETQNGYILSCQSYAKSDIEIIF